MFFQAEDGIRVHCVTGVQTCALPIFGSGANATATYLYTGAKHINYFTGEGLDNLLIDEQRDDGIDKDGDWDPLTDDVGADGVDRKSVV